MHERGGQVTTRGGHLALFSRAIYQIIQVEVPYALSHGLLQNVPPRLEIER